MYVRVHTCPQTYAQMAPMSTTKSREIANSYAQGKAGGLLFRFITKGRSKGVPIDFLSVYPKEKEFLYPPLTGLEQDEHLTVTTEDGVMIVPVRPTMS